MGKYKGKREKKKDVCEAGTVKIYYAEIASSQE